MKKLSIFFGLLAILSMITLIGLMFDDASANNTVAMCISLFFTFFCTILFLHCDKVAEYKK